MCRVQFSFTFLKFLSKLHYQTNLTSNVLKNVAFSSNISGFSKSKSILSSNIDIWEVMYLLKPQNIICNLVKINFFCFFFVVFRQNNSLPKICRITSFPWPLFSHIRIESLILSFNGKIRVRENQHFGKFYILFLRRSYDFQNLK